MVEASEIVAYASDAAFAVDPHFSIIAWNEGAEALLGYASGEVLGRPCYEVVKAVLAKGQPLCAPGCEGSFCFNRGRPFAARACRARHRRGHWVALEFASLLVRNGAEEGGVGTAIVLLRPERDASARRRTHEGQLLRVFALGRFGLSVGDREVAIDRWNRRHALTLLRFLLCHNGEAMHRERIIEALWPKSDERRGRERLKVTVCALRRELRLAGLGEEVVATLGPAYALRREMVWTDKEAFEELAARGLALAGKGRAEEARGALEAAERLYRGDYLEEEPYADWCAEERERLREVYLDLLAHLVESHATEGNLVGAEHLCRKALAREPSREWFHRSIMTYLLRLGQPDRALAQYRRCRQVLAEELGVEPTQETQKVYRAVVGALRPAGAAGGSANRPPGPQPAAAPPLGGVP